MRTTLVSAVIVSVGIAFGGYYIGSSFLKAKALDRYVSVKGIAEQLVESDFATWSIPFTAQDTHLQKAYGTYHQNLALLEKFLQEKGFGKEAYTLGPVAVTPPENGSKTPIYRVKGSIDVHTTQLDLLDKAVVEVQTLITQGVYLGSWGYVPSPQYYFNNLDSLRPKMIADGTQSARSVALQFAKEAKSTLGTIRQASQGQFQILPPYGDMNYGSAEHRKKKIRLVTTVDFYLKG